jgi:hypothetical protein
LGLPNNGEESFLERYAGIESGQECERLAPALSAFVDGEADAAQMGRPPRAPAPVSGLPGQTERVCHVEELIAGPRCGPA